MYRSLGRLLAAVIIASVVLVGHVTVAVAEPQLVVTSPTNGATIRGNTVTVSFRVTDLTIVPTSVPVAEAGRHPEANRPGEGHLHFMLDLEPLVVWERTTPYTFTNVPPGEHELVVELTENDHGPLTPPVAQRIRLTTTPLLSNAGSDPAVGYGSWLPYALGVAVLSGAGLLWRRRVRRP
jgi:hypothetical protein